MAYIVDPASDAATHHILLDDGAGTQLGLILLDPNGNPDPRAIDEQSNPRTAMRVASGAGGYGDFEQPYSPQVQGDFSSGMGQEKFEEDTTKYYDGNCIDTSRGKLMPAGKVTTMSGYKSTTTKGVSDAEINVPVRINPAGTSVTPYSLGSTFTAEASATMRSVSLNARWDQSYTGTKPLTIELYADAAGLPGALLASGGVQMVYTTGMQLITVPISYPLINATKYHLVVSTYTNLTDNSNMIVQKDSSESGCQLLQYVNPSGSGGWVQIFNDQSLVFSYINTGAGNMHFFEYMGLTWAINRGYDGSAPNLYVNGIYGDAASNATDMKQLYTNSQTTLLDTTVGAKVRIVSGPGSGEGQPWRTIVAESKPGTKYIFQTNEAWNTPQTTATRFAILGMDKWYPVTVATFPPTKPILDVLVVDGYVYLCQDGANMVRMSMTSWSASGIPVMTGADEGNAKDQIEMLTDSDGKKKVFSVVKATSAVYKADIATPFVWTQLNNNLPCGSSDAKITALAIYGEPQIPYILKEDSFGSVASNATGNTASSSVYAPIPISAEMAGVRSESNGRAWCQSNRFLYFSVGEGVERYYQGILDDVGPDRGIGLPADRRGSVADMVAYPGGVIYASLDAGESGYSSVLKYNGQGWTEVYRCSVVGKRIRKLFIQNIPGAMYQRLMISEEEDILWLPIAKNPLRATGFQFATTCEWTSSWIYTAYKDVKKFWNALKIFALNISATKTVTAYYRTDNNTTWNQFASYTSGPSQELEFNPSAANVANDVIGHRIQIRLVMTTDDPLTPVYIETLLLEAVTRVPGKKAWNITARASDFGADLKGNMDPLDAKGIKTILDTWADSRQYAKRILMSSLVDAFTTKRVFIEPGSYKVLRHTQQPAGSMKQTDLLVRLTLIEG